MDTGGSGSYAPGMSSSISAPDLTQRPPRSPRVRLGGLVLLPRMLDKGRAADSDAETLAYFAEAVGKVSKTREDIQTWFAYIDADDFATFGGKP